MIETPSPDALVQRLVVQRLEAPGVLDRGTLQRAMDRASPPSSTQMLDRLRGRVVEASPGVEQMPLARGARLADHDVSGSAGARSTTSAFVNGDVPRTAVASVAPSSFVSPSVTRQTPTISPLATLIARQVDTSKPGGFALATPPLVARRASPSSVSPRASGVAVQRSLDPTSIGRAINGGEPVSQPMPSAAQEQATSMIMRTPSTMKAADSLQRASMNQGIRQIQRVDATTPSIGTPAFLPLRKARESIQRSTAETGPTTTPLNPIIGAPASPLPSLVMRTIETGPPSGGRAAVETSAEMSNQTVPAATSADAAPSSRSWRPADERNIEWITEQVGLRLARRLEIERERMGVRRWRQVS